MSSFTLRPLYLLPLYLLDRRRGGPHSRFGQHGKKLLTLLGLKIGPRGRPDRSQLPQQSHVICLLGCVGQHHFRKPTAGEVSLTTRHSGTSHASEANPWKCLEAVRLIAQTQSIISFLQQNWRWGTPFPSQRCNSTSHFWEERQIPNAPLLKYKEGRNWQ